MPKLAHVAVASLFVTALAGCAASTEPSPTGADPSESNAASPEGAPAARHAALHTEATTSPAISILPICLPPVTAMTGAWSCGASGVRTGEKSATTTSGYTNNCSGRATVEFTTPTCGSAGPHPTQYDELSITALDVYSLSATDCPSAYLDYYVWGLNVSTNNWDTIRSGRLYGTYNGSGCSLNVESYPLSAQYSQIEMSADAYMPTYLYFFGHTYRLNTPSNLFFDASFIE
ncbi:MAG TPA: hypothetical protein VGI39_21530 [Polyangiaceae bacterium]|jgi:hypothetical protein